VNAWPVQLVPAFNELTDEALQQARQRALTWPEKVCMAEAVREWAAKFRPARPIRAVSATESAQAGVPVPPPLGRSDFFRCLPV
jgi:hypothetical protein